MSPRKGLVLLLVLDLLLLDLLDMDMGMDMMGGWFLSLWVALVRVRMNSSVTIATSLEALDLNTRCSISAAPAVLTATMAGTPLRVGLRIR